MYIDNLISIVIITCNREKELKTAINSCIKFASMNCEILVVDNKSNDGTRDMLEKINIPPHISLRSYFMDTNLGVAGARNYGFNKANSRVVLFLDDDAYFAEGSNGLGYAYNYLLENSSIFAIAPEIYDLKKKHLLKDIVDKKNPNKVFSFIGASHFIRKDYVRTEHLYPEKLFYGSEEIYACLCAYNQGYYIEYNPNIKVIHNPSVFTRSNEYEIGRNICINKFVVKKLTLPKSLLVMSTGMFYLRIAKLCKLNLKKCCEWYALYEKRFIENKYARDRLTLKIAIDLIKRFGINRVL